MKKKKKKKKKKIPSRWESTTIQTKEVTISSLQFFQLQKKRV